jgi:hypothetical protein
MNLKLSTMSSRKYSGKHLNATGCSSGRGSGSDFREKLVVGDTSLSTHIMTYRMNCIERACAVSSRRTP